MKIKSVRTRVFEWKGKVVPPPAHFCTNASDILFEKGDAMGSFRFHGWLVVEAEQDPAIAHPLTYARLGYNNLSRLARDAGLI